MYRLENTVEEMIHMDGLVKLLVAKGVNKTMIASILYEEFVSLLGGESEDFTEKQLEEIIDSISDYRRKHNLYE
jgi:hypothetical protein